MLRGFGEEEVDGVIIGSITFPYEFWIDEPCPEYADRNGKRRVTKGNFENDEQAVGWFKTSISMGSRCAFGTNRATLTAGFCVANRGISELPLVCSVHANSSPFSWRLRGSMVTNDGTLAALQRYHPTVPSRVPLR